MLFRFSREKLLMANMHESAAQPAPSRCGARHARSSAGRRLATDAFFVAFRIPNLLRRLFAEGAFSQAFVPVLAEHKNRQTPEETRR